MHKARRLLDHYENRDVIYTIMRARWLQERRRDRDRRKEEDEEEGAEMRAAPAAEEERGRGRGREEGETGEGKQRRGDEGVDGDGDANGDIDMGMEREFQSCLHILRNEAGLADGGDGVTTGIGTNIVAMRVAGMGVRALEFN